MIRKHHYAEVQAIAAGAVNQSVKAILLTKQVLQFEEIQIAFTAVLVDVEIGGSIKTAIKFITDPAARCA